MGVRRLQAVGLRPRDTQDDAQPLPPDQEHARLVRQVQARLLLDIAYSRRPLLRPATANDETAGRSVLLTLNATMRRRYLLVHRTTNKISLMTMSMTRASAPRYGKL